MTDAASVPLKGLRVVEMLGDTVPLHVQLAIALAGKIARELGADVMVARRDGGTIDIGRCGNGDNRSLFTFLYGDKILLSRNGIAAIGTADAILADLSVPLPENKAAVVVSDFGSNSKVHHAPTSELTILAMSGLLHVLGLQAGRPVRLPGHQPAYAAGLAAYLAMVAGLMSYTPRVADVSILDAMLWVNWKLPAVAMLNRDVAPTRGGEWQAMETKDGHVALVYQDRDWPALVDLLGIPELCDSRFATRSTRLSHYDALMDILRPWFTARTKDEIYTLAKQRGLPLGPVWTAEDIQRDAQYIERDFIRLLPGAGFMPRIPLMWDGLRPGTYVQDERASIGETLDA